MAVTATQHRLHCSGLGDDIDDEALAGRFKSFGAVQGVEIIRSSDGGCPSAFSYRPVGGGSGSRLVGLPAIQA